jgi:uncharacterized membrane protein YdbT with pleckstrin-like domain
MEEQTVWKGSSSQVINLGTYLVYVVITLMLLALFIGALNGRSSPGFRIAAIVFGVALVVPLLIGIWKWIANRCRVYEVTTQRIRVTRGIFSKRTDELELYRVRDSSLVEPFLYRMFGAGNIEIVTMDVSTPGLTLEAIKGAAAVREELRKNIEACRDRKGVRVTEFE